MNADRSFAKAINQGLKRSKRLNTSSGRGKMVATEVVHNEAQEWAKAGYPHTRAATVLQRAAKLETEAVKAG